MNVMVAGQNLMALRIAEELMQGHQVVSLRSDNRDSVGFDKLDVESVIGAATSTDALRAARIQVCDVFVGCTDSDEQNIVACLAAKRLGAQRTICVLQSPGFLNVGEADRDLAESLGIDDVVRPGEQLAQEIVRIVTIPGALDARVFAEGQVALLRYAVEAGAPITLGPLKNLQLPRGVLLVMVRRGDDMIVPHGATRIEAGDKVVAMGQRSSINELTPLLRAKQQKHRLAAAIVGAGSVGLAIARGLEQAKWSVKLIEVDRNRCELVAAELQSMVLHGDGADLDLLEQERIGEMPVVVCVTNNDEKNLLVSLLTKELGVPRIVTRADRLHNERMFEKVGVDVVLSATGAAVRTIVQSIDTSHAEIRAELEHGSACVIELKLPDNFPEARLMDLTPPELAVVGSISRGRQLVIPRGLDTLRPGDQILVFCSTANEEETRQFFMERGDRAEQD